MSIYEKGKISVIMGIYNCEDTLKESIESIINQTYDNWELIMCDDMSTDNTYNIAKNYENKYPNKIKLIRNIENCGLAHSLNHCLEYITGEYVARQDGDDLSVENRFETQIKFLNEHSEYDLVASKMISFDENGVNGLRGVVFDEPQKTDLRKSTAFCHATIMARHYVYKTLNGYKVNKYTMRCEDVDLWFRFFAKGYRGYNLSEGLYMVRDDINAYKRRTLKSYLYLMKVNFDGYRMVNMPKKYYVFLIKPILSALIPRSIMKKYHRQCITSVTQE